LLKPAPYFGRLKPSAHGLGKWLGYIDKFIIFPIRLRRLARRPPSSDPLPIALRPSPQLPLLIHICDHSNAMYSLALAGVPHVVTCHDLLAVRSALGHFPGNKVGWTGRLLQRWIIRGLRHSAAIVCDSEATRRDLLALGGVDPSRAATVHIGLNHPYAVRDEAWLRAGLAALPQVGKLGPGGYIFHVGGNQWYKNRAGVLRIYFAYVNQGGRLPLVMAGKALPPELAELVAARPAGATVFTVGNVSNDQLNALYGRAACLLFPSLQEGFGWPVLEAMASGCPVVCSDRASLPEVGGEAVRYFDPADEAGATRQLATLLTETPEARAARIGAGLEQAGKFNTRAMLEQLAGHYGKLLETQS
jgi:glycosyltransferase involved in cell wall biosynthesis